MKLQTGRRVTFKRGKIARAKRDVLARRLARKKKIKDPFGLATYQVRKGVKIPNGEVKQEFAEQKRMAKRLRRRKKKRHYSSYSRRRIQLTTIPILRWTSFSL